MPQLYGLHHIAISVPPDASDQTVTFYRDVLGFPELPVPGSITSVPIITWFQIGRNEMHLIEEPGNNEGKRRHICLEVDELDSFRTRLESAGERIEEGEPIPGRPRFFCYDPAGNRIEFLVEASGK